MSITHNFWILPPDFNPAMDRILQERYGMWGVVPLQGRYQEDAACVRRFLKDFCIRKKHQAIHVNNHMMLEALSSFLDVKTLRNGWLPSRGISIQETTVVPAAEVPRLMLAIMVQPPSAAWHRLYDLCGQAIGKDWCILHESVLPTDGDTQASDLANTSRVSS